MYISSSDHSAFVVRKITVKDFVLYSAVICEPPCVEGACVANDTCNCIEGYVGERCTEPGNYTYI